MKLLPSARTRNRKLSSSVHFRHIHTLTINSSFLMQAVFAILHSKQRLDITSAVCHSTGSQGHCPRRMPLQCNFLPSDLPAESPQADVAVMKTENMEDAARIITKAFTDCVVDRCVWLFIRIYIYNDNEQCISTSAPSESRKWGVYYVVGLVLKCYFRVCLISSYS